MLPQKAGEIKLTSESFDSVCHSVVECCRPQETRHVTQTLLPEETLEWKLRSERQQRNPGQQSCWIQSVLLEKEGYKPELFLRHESIASAVQPQARGETDSVKGNVNNRVSAFFGWVLNKSCRSLFSTCFTRQTTDRWNPLSHHLKIIWSQNSGSKAEPLWQYHLSNFAMPPKDDPVKMLKNRLSFCVGDQTQVWID